MSLAFNLDDFSRQLDAYARTQVTLIAKNLGVFAFKDLATRIVQATPILTGRARYNWQPSVDTPIDNTALLGPGDVAPDVTHPGASGTTGDPLTPAEQQRIQDICDQYLKNPQATLLWLTNNLTYIQALEHGHSQKAPAGMVDVSLEATLDVLQRQGAVT